MQNTYRIKTEIGKDKVVNFQLDQNIEFLELLSFKVRQSDVYTLDCANYGVVAGRITANNGFGVPNARVSVFIPLSEEDENNELITSIYPYKSISDKNEDGYRYNLLPYEPSYPGHVATGTFPTLNDVMTDGQAIEVYEKYYKYTVKTNSSGDYMIFGVPVGSYSVLMDLDLSDIGEFSLTPQDLIRMGRATEAQFKGNSFQSSPDLASLPQIVSLSKGVEISPLWGDPETCDSTINRIDFDLRDDANIDIQPTAIFIGSIFGTSNIDSVRIDCGVKESMGNLCQLETGPGQILAIRQTKNLDEKGLPILEQYELENSGRVIDGDGTWVVELPMNLEYVVTDENGNQVITNDAKIGIPRKGKYRFKVKWQDSDNTTDTSRKAHFLIPNIKEYGWVNGSFSDDPITSSDAKKQKELAGSYYFGLDWTGYTNYNAAINCEDTFYEFEYNKTYTVAGLVDQYQTNIGQGKFIGIKEIGDRTCEQNVNKYPVNDGVKNFSLMYFLFSVITQLLQFIYIPILFGYHLVTFLWNYLAVIVLPAIITLTGYQIYNYLTDISNLQTMYSFLITATTFIPTALSFSTVLLAQSFAKNAKLIFLIGFEVFLILNFARLVKRKIKTIHLPSITYPNCEFCNCDMEEVDVEVGESYQTNGLLSQFSNQSLYFTNLSDNFKWSSFSNILGITDDSKYEEDKDIITLLMTQAIAGRTENANSRGGGETDRKMPRSDEYKLPAINKKMLIYSETLPIGERINYFNLRDNYFSGSNKIEVSFASDLDVNKFVYHYDNVIVVLSDVEIKPGEVITFVDNKLSKDVNFKFTGLTDNDETFFGVPGSVKINEQNRNITVKYAVTQDIELESTQYTLPIVEDVTNTSYYPSDIEYFQVLTGLTYSNYIAVADKTKKGYLPSILTSPTLLRVKLDGDIGKELIIYNPIQYFQDIDNKYVLILQRGVDPYSPEYTNTYGLGKIFGHDDYSAVKITTSAKLNIPIQKLNKKETANSYTVQTLTNVDDVFFESYLFEPNNQFKTYKTDALSFYAGILNDTGLILNPQIYVLGVLPYIVTFIKNWIKGSPSSITTGINFFIQNGERAGPKNEYPKITPNSLLDSKYSLSKLDFNGGSYMVGVGNIKDKNDFLGSIDRYMLYYSYSSHREFKDSLLEKTNKNKIVLRTDRLPTSDILDGSNWQSNGVGILQQNNAFNIYVIPKKSKGEQTPIYINSAFDSSIITNNLKGLPYESNVISSFSNCSNLVSFDCYENDSTGRIKIKDICKTKNNKVIQIKNGCYVLVKRPILDLSIDMKAFREWLLRFRLNFALCQGIISETFSNNWVNGSLFMFSFRLNKFGGNQLNPIYCKDIVYYDRSTNNFYYRSSPYSISAKQFVGSSTQSNTSINLRNLKYPTTVINLGIKNRLETRSSDFSSFAYVVNALNATSHYDNSDLLNLFIVSRILDSNVWMKSLANNTLVNSFFSRLGKKVDGDLAQILSINSEFGVVKFSPEIYAFTETNSPTIVFRENNKNFMGVFYSSSQADLQLKDHITPGRVNFRQGNTLVIQNYGNKSQEVPFYSWMLAKTTKTIFGNDGNDWGTNQSNFVSKRYQSLERIKPNNPIENYTTTDYFSDSSFDLSYNNDRGYIFAEKDGKYNQESSRSDSFVVGAPFHFYFGIKKGFSALDKFKTKYLNE